MAQIYEKASLTVAASSSPADAEGFLKIRTQYLSKAFTISHPSLENGQADFHVRTPLGKHKRHDVSTLVRDSWRSNMLGPASRMEPLDYRAWCFQEKLVSRRLLSYCSEEFEWDCNSGEDCECGSRHKTFGIDGWDNRNGSSRQIYQSIKQDTWHASKPPQRGGNSMQLSMAMIDLLRPPRDTRDSPADDPSTLLDSITHPMTPDPNIQVKFNAWKVWRHNLVPSYSQLKLTHEMDRLPALSAIARGLAPVCGGPYIAGMWFPNLDVSLAWKAGAYGTFGPQPGRFPQCNRSPSWS